MKKMKLFIAAVIIIVLCFSMALPALAATDVLLQSDTIKLSYTVGSNSSCTSSTDGKTVTVTVYNGTLSHNSAEVTLYNHTASSATLSFDYVLSNKYTSFTIDSASAAASGSYSNLLNSGGSVTIKLEGKNGYKIDDAKLVISNLSLVVAAEKSTVTLGEYDTTLGSATVAGSTSGTGNTETSVALAATPGSGTTFLGWVNAATGEVIAASASYSYYPAQNVTVVPAFAKSSAKAWFSAGGGAYLFDNLTTAVTYASSATNKMVVLAADGTLSGTHTIPSGVTLLIPNDDANTPYTTTPGKSNSAASAYRTLIMANGASITVNGAISIAGMQNGNHNAYADGAASGSLGYINMQTGSTITVNKSAYLYCWGYIIGDGAVDVYGTVYEDLQIADWRGGDALSDIYNNDLGIMPLTMFYVQNVQVPMTLYYGAVENVVTRATSSVFDKQIPCVFLGTGGVVGLSDSNATLIKDYDDENDRIEFTLNGNCTIGGITITVPTGLLSEVKIDSTNFYMPVNTTWDFTVKEGSDVTVSQDVALTPGSRFIIESDATVSLAENVKICVYDADNWGAYAFTGSPDCDNIHVPANLRDLVSTHDHADEYTRDAMIQVDGILDTSKGNFYTTTGGANICSTDAGQIIVGTNANTIVYQYEQINDTQDSGSNDYKTVGTVEIDATPSQLKNADGSYVATGNVGSGTYTYKNGFWYPEFCITLDSCSLDVASEMLLNFYFYIPDEIKSGLYATITEENNNVTTYEPVNITEFGSADSLGTYKLSRGIASGEMTGTVTVQFFNSESEAIKIYDKRNQTVVEGGVTRTALDYAKLAIAAGAQETADEAAISLRNMCQAMLVFGSKAQTFFNTHTDKLADANLEEAVKTQYSTLTEEAQTELSGFTATAGGDSLGISAVSQLVNLDSNVYLRVYFSLDDINTLDSYAFTVTKPAGNGTATTQESVTPKTEAINGVTYAYIDVHIPPAYWGENYTITVSNDSGEYSVNTSVMSWVRICVEQSTDDNEVALARAMYHFYKTANTYF